MASPRQKKNVGDRKKSGLNDQKCRPFATKKGTAVLAKKRGPVSKVIDIENERGLREPRRATKTHTEARLPLLLLSQALYAWEE